MTNGGVRFRYNKDTDENLTEEQIEFKRRVRERIIEARKHGVPFMEMVKPMKGQSVHLVLDMIEAKPFPMSAWEEMDRVLEKIGY